MKSYQKKGLKGGAIMFAVGGALFLMGSPLCSAGLGILVGLPMVVVGILTCLLSPLIGWAISHVEEVNMNPRGPSGYGGHQNSSPMAGQFAPVSMLLVALAGKFKSTASRMGAEIRHDLLMFKTGGQAYFKQSARALWTRLQSPAQSGLSLAWYDQYPVIFVTLFLFWPVGLFCVWRTRRFERSDKILLTAATLIWLLLVGLSSAGA